jgi:hypothetical protein
VRSPFLYYSLQYERDNRRDVELVESDMRKIEFTSKSILQKKFIADLWIHLKVHTLKFYKKVVEILGAG